MEEDQVTSPLIYEHLQVGLFSRVPVGEYVNNSEVEPVFLKPNVTIGD